MIVNRMLQSKSAHPFLGRALHPKPKIPDYWKSWQAAAVAQPEYLNAASQLS